MAAPRIDRRLTAVLAADVVGYSRLVQRDEQGTFGRLKAHRGELVEPLVAEHGGRVVKLMGDGILCEFPSAVHAVACAVAIQKGVAERERAVPEAERVRFRIGTVSGLGVQAAMTTGGFRSLAAWKRCPKPVPSVPL